MDINLSDREISQILDNGDASKMAQLIENGLNVDFYFEDGFSPLGVAIMNDDIDMVHLLYDYTSVDGLHTEQGEYGMMDTAIMFNSHKAIMAFLNKGYSFYNIPLKEFKKEFQETLKNWKTKQDVLIDAVKEGDIEKVLMYCKNPLYLAQTNEKKENALFLAYQLNHPNQQAIFDILMATKIYKNQTNQDGDSLLHVVIEDFAYKRQTQRHYLDTLLHDKNVDLNCINYRKDSTCIFSLIETANLDLIEEILPKLKIEKIKNSLLRNIDLIKKRDTKTQHDSHLGHSATYVCDILIKQLPMLIERQKIEQSILKDRDKSFSTSNDNSIKRIPKKLKI